METLVIEKVVEHPKELPYGLQWRVLEFTCALALTTPRGVPGKQLLRFAGAIPASDVELMRRAIEQGCERVDTDGGSIVRADHDGPESDGGEARDPGHAPDR